jgi:hypothetical protein
MSQFDLRFRHCSFALRWRCQNDTPPLLSENVQAPSESTHQAAETPCFSI